MSVEELADWLRTTTGREFTSPPQVDYYDATPATHQAIEEAISVEQWSLWSTLGLIAPNESRRSAAAAWLETRSGSCCPARILRSDDELRTAVISLHELVHALDWDRMQPGVGNAHLSPMASIAEGNAQRLARMWAREAGASEAEVDQASALFTDGTGADLPPVVRRILEYPYREGLSFAVAIHDARGEEAIVEAFTRPPNGAEVLHPERWLNNESWPTVQPPTDLLITPPTGSGRLGAFMLSLMIEPTLGQADAHELMASWAGDAYAISHTIEQSCVALRIALEDPASAAALERALRTTGGFASTTSTTINYTRCT